MGQWGSGGDYFANSNEGIQLVSPLTNEIVALVKSDAPAGGYGLPEDDLVPADVTSTTAFRAVRDLFAVWGLDGASRGLSSWNPLSKLITKDSRVAIKPNWVYHAPRGPATLDCLITHTSLIQAVLHYVALAKPSSVVLGDAPLQSCDFATLRRVAALDDLADWAKKQGIALEIADFRRTINPSGHSADSRRVQSARSMDRFALFDLGDESLLSALNRDAKKFRVTGYDPDLMNRTHSEGKHEYLIAREILDADVVINLPKLKCHAKSGITGALKNLIGINGHKEYLPHHRKGGTSSDGDCYSGSVLWKQMMENMADFVNRERGARAMRYVLGRGMAAIRKAIALTGADDNIEGSWYRNDTIWRTCLDLNRILLYGSSDGRLHSNRQRTVISITDAIVAGENEGPLKPTPVQSSFLTGALNPAAADYVNARLMGLDPQRIPIVQKAFDDHDKPLAPFKPESIRVVMQDGSHSGVTVEPIRYFVPAAGWRGHCELQCEHAPLENHLASV